LQRFNEMIFIGCKIAQFTQAFSGKNLFRHLMSCLMGSPAICSRHFGAQFDDRPGLTHSKHGLIVLFDKF
jgi:hypothetical protein